MQFSKVSHSFCKKELSRSSNRCSVSNYTNGALSTQEGRRKRGSRTLFPDLRHQNVKEDEYFEIDALRALPMILSRLKRRFASNDVITTPVEEGVLLLASGYFCKNLGSLTTESSARAYCSSTSASKRDVSESR